MPYITEKRKQELGPEGKLPTTAGDLTYLVTMAAIEGPAGTGLERACETQIDRYLEGREGRYEDFCIVVGALGCAALELERRRPSSSRAKWQATTLRVTARHFYDKTLAPYEDRKIQENGDVFDVPSTIGAT